MTRHSLRLGLFCSFALFLAAGCQQAPQQVKSELQSDVSSGHLSILKWPDFSDYQPLVNTFL